MYISYKSVYDSQSYVDSTKLLSLIVNVVMLEDFH